MISIIIIKNTFIIIVVVVIKIITFRVYLIFHPIMKSVDNSNSSIVWKFWFK